MQVMTGQEIAAQLPPIITQLGQRFHQSGHEIALVGGPVRDSLLGKVTHDLDFTTSARPEETLEIIKNWADAVWDIGKEFGTIGLTKNAQQFEITTWRADSYNKDSRKPTVKYGDNLEDDLFRRDFTVNALALDLKNYQIVDPTGGLEDLKAGLLSTPIEPEESFNDDPLRILRAARFTAQLGFDVEWETMEAMTQMAQRLSIVSAERIGSEIERLIMSDYPRRGLEIMVYTGIANLVLPEISALVEMQDEHGRHKDVYEHSLTVLEQAIDLETGPDGPVPGPDLVLRMAALLHDIGKPATRRFEAGGVVSFHQHDIVGAKMAAKRLKALRFDKKTSKAICKLIALHQRFHGYGEQAWTDTAVRRYVADAGEQLQRLHRLTRSDCTTRSKRKAARLSHAYDDLERRIEELAKQEELLAIRPDLDGTEIMEILNLKPGPAVGAAYKYLLNLRMEHGPLGSEKARMELLRWWETWENNKTVTKGEEQ